MPQQRGTDGTEDDLPTYIRKAFGHDRSWMQDGSCHVSLRPDGVPHMAWVVPKGETRVVDGQRYIGDEMERIAMPICRECPQQWLCARWAIEVDERTGTWSMPYKRLVWLKKQPDALNIIDTARVNNIPIERAVILVQGRRV